MKQKTAKPKQKISLNVAIKINKLLTMMRYRFLRQHWAYSRWGIGLLIVLVIFVFSVPSGLGVRASESRVYPTYCLGGWQYPQNAGGEPNLELQSPGSAFSSDNSAILKDSLADMFCGYFQGEAHDNPPSRAVLKFSWQIDADDTIQPAPSTSPSEVLPLPEESLPPIDIQLDTPADVPAGELINTDKSVGFPVQAQSVIVDTADSIVPEITPIKIVVPDPVPVPVPDPDPISIQPAPQSEPTPEPIMIEPAPTPMMETPQETDGFLQVQYSFDGLSWKSLGAVTMTNWRSFEPEIPVHSWDQVNTLQVVISAKSTFDQQPTVKLDGLWLETQYNPTFLEAISDLGDQTNDLLAGLVDDAGQSLTELNDALTPGDQQPEAVDGLSPTALKSNPDESVIQPAFEPLPPPPPALIAKRHLLFTAGGESLPTSNILPWFTRDDLKVLQLDETKPLTISSAPLIEQSVSGKSMIVSGFCDTAHYVILLYKNPTDYQKNPGAYAVNVAKSCVGGRYQFDLIAIPDTLSVGTYYLLIGAQGLAGPWRPASALVPITVGSKIEEEKQ